MIEIKNLDFSYKKTPVFSNISLRFEPGNIYGLLGENGVGKTTLLKLMCGLQRPVQGTCTVDGVTCHDRLPQMLQRMVFLPDEVSLPDNATPHQYVNELAPFYPGYAYGTFLHLMQELEVDPERKFREMSFGQQKKSLIACALSRHRLRASRRAHQRPRHPQQEPVPQHPQQARPGEKHHHHLHPSGERC